VLEHLENIIQDSISESSIPSEFKVEFRLMPQAIQFNMLSDDQVKLIIEVVFEMIKKIQVMVVASGKMEYLYSMTYPFETQTDKEKAIVEIIIEYRDDAIFDGKRVIITHD
jgi:hypothetical protein